MQHIHPQSRAHHFLEYHINRETVRRTSALLVPHELARADGQAAPVAHTGMSYIHSPEPHVQHVGIGTCRLKFCRNYAVETVLKFCQNFILHRYMLRWVMFLSSLYLPWFLAPVKIASNNFSKVHGATLELDRLQIWIVAHKPIAPLA